jgi:hypothetical protein
MVQLPPPGPVAEAPPAPAFDPVLVRDFFHYLQVAIHGDAPETSRVSNFMETAALGLHYWFESGVSVFVTGVMPIADAIPMLKFLKKKAARADWVTFNMDHLERVANISLALFKLGTELKTLRSLLKIEADMEIEEKILLCDKLIEACDKVYIMIPGARDAGLSVLLPELARDTLAVAGVAEEAAATVRQAAVSEKIWPAKPLHKLVKKAYRDLQVLLKATPVDLPEVNPFLV